MLSRQTKIIHKWTSKSFWRQWLWLDALLNCTMSPRFRHQSVFWCTWGRAIETTCLCSHSGAPKHLTRSRTSLASRKQSSKSRTWKRGTGHARMVFACSIGMLVYVSEGVELAHSNLFCQEEYFRASRRERGVMKDFPLAFLKSLRGVAEVKKCSQAAILFWHAHSELWKT